MKTTTLLLCFSFSLFVYVSYGQSNNSDSEGLRTITTSTKHGTLKINLPNTLYSGDVISGTVQSEPSGTNERQTQKSQNALNNYSILINGVEWTTENSPQQLNIPNASSFTVEIRNDSGKSVYEESVNISPIGSSPSLAGLAIPSYLRSGYSNTIIGNFDGLANNTSVLLNNEPLTILAESPRSLICEVPDNRSGVQTLEISDNNMEQNTSINVIDMHISVDQLNLSRGESTMLHIEITGLEDLSTPVDYDIENLSPGNINLEAGNMQHITIQPNDVNASGTYINDLTIRAVTTGGFSISCQLSPPPLENPQQPDNGNGESLTNNDPDPNTSNTSGEEYDMLPNGPPLLVNANYDNSDVNFTVIIPQEDIQEERNKARKIPSTTSLEPRDPDDKDKPYSRPIPKGVKGDKGYKGKVWPDPQELLDSAKAQVKRAKSHKGKIETGVPGYGTRGILFPSETRSTTNAKGVKCKEYVYYLRQRFTYLNDRTLLFEEQLSPSYPFFVAEGKSKIDVTETESGWEVGTKVTAGKGPVEVEVSGKYWEKTTKIKGKGSSSLKGRHLWLFHVGRLYLNRRAFLRITYEYHYEVCDDGTTRNWVNTTYTDNWIYWYDWQEELFVAHKDDEGNFHRVDAFPLTVKNTSQGETSESYEVDDLERGQFRNPHSERFFPNN